MSAAQASDGAKMALSLLEALRGTAWRFERELVSRLASMPGCRVEGTARFTARGGDDALVYSEAGSMRLGERALPGRKSYVWLLGQAPTLAVRFDDADEGLFHDLALAREDASTAIVGRPAASHLCGPDMYDSVYRFEFDGAAVDAFQIVHVARGPDKDYTATTRYRLDAGLTPA